MGKGGKGKGGGMVKGKVGPPDKGAGKKCAGKGTLSKTAGHYYKVPLWRNSKFTSPRSTTQPNPKHLSQEVRLTNPQIFHFSVCPCNYVKMDSLTS
jgi:hypothetical protein